MVDELSMTFLEDCEIGYTEVKCGVNSGNFGCAMVAQGLCLLVASLKQRKMRGMEVRDIVHCSTSLAGLAFKPWGAHTFFLRQGHHKGQVPHFILDLASLPMLWHKRACLINKPLWELHLQEMIRASFSVVKNKLADSKCGCGTSFSPLDANCFLPSKLPPHKNSLSFPRKHSSTWNL